LKFAQGQWQTFFGLRRQAKRDAAFPGGIHPLFIGLR
jgi:hypothetical protein